MSTQELSPLKVWLMAIRPPTLLVGLSPVLVGLSLGWYRLTMIEGTEVTWTHWAASMLAIFLVIFLQSAANLINDAKDAEAGVDAGPRLGPPRVVQMGLLSGRTVRRAYQACFVLATLLFIGLMWGRIDTLMIVTGSLCIAAAYLYTGGPYPLAYYGFGEALALIFFGPIAVMGTSYLLVPSLDWEAAAWGIGTGLLSASLMAINNYRDRLGDERAGKHTLAIFLGGEKGRLVPITLAISACLMIIFFAWMHTTVQIAGIIWILSFYLQYRWIYPYIKRGPAEQNLALKRTAIFTFGYSILFALLVWS